MAEDRTDRATQVATERRRRDGSSISHRLKLAVPDKVRDELAAQGRTPRWVNDTGNRISDLTTRDDYDKVEGVDPVKVGTGEDGKPVLAHLLSKRDDFITEDRRTIDQRRREIEASRFGTDREPAKPSEGQMGAPTYVDSETKIGRRNEVLE